MASNNPLTPADTPTTLAEVADQPDSSRNFPGLEHSSRATQYHGTRSSSSAADSSLTSHSSTAQIGAGTTSYPTVQNEHSTVRDWMTEEPATQLLASQSDASLSVPVDFPAEHAVTQVPPEDARASIYHQGQPDYRALTYPHPHSQRTDYIGPYVLPAQHMAVAHPTSPLYPYHGYHHPQSHAQTYSYTPQGPSPSHSPYPLTPIHQGAHTGTQTSSHPQFVAGPYPALHYTSPLEYPYRHSNYPASAPALYAQYAQASYPQHFGSPPESEQQGTWWYIPAVHPFQQQHQFEGNHPHHPGFQRHFTYPYVPMSTSNVEHSQGLTSVSPQQPPLPSQSSSTSRTSAFSRQRSPVKSSAPQANVEANPAAASEKPLVRQAYHPKAPVYRSEWTMWAGNIPSDAKQDEMWRFFGQLPSLAHPEVDDVDPVVSVFLINRSSCAFINYDTEAHLSEAIDHFNGKLLRPNDPRCPKLVCRVRKKDEDLRAGVGGQRGMGMHSKWVKEKMDKKPASSPPELGGEDSPGPSARVMQSLSLSSSDEERRRHEQVKYSSSSGSYTSTTSSFLSRHFPRRYFVLKSLTQHDLDLSVEKELWATQKHNEGVLDQAFRTSQEVFLIFGVNKSGEFYGYAKMAGPIQSGEQEVAWQTRRAEIPSRSSTSEPHGEGGPPQFLSPSDRRLINQSPTSLLAPGGSTSDQLLSPGDDDDEPAAIFSTDVVHNQTAPAEIGTRPKLSVTVPQHHHTFELPIQRPEAAMSPTIALDSEAPQRAVRSTYKTVDESEPDEVKGDDQEGSEAEHTWGESFRVEWLCLERLPFYRIKHLRNFWNHDREVKVSRDGTELEPTVGGELVEKWHTLATGADPSSPPAGSASKGKRPASRKNRPGD